MNSTRSIKKVYRKFNLDRQPTDFAFWQSQPYEKRPAALEEIRREYHGVNVDFIDLANLKKNKQATGRHQDLADLENLK